MVYVPTFTTQNNQLLIQPMANLKTFGDNMFSRKNKVQTL